MFNPKLPKRELSFIDSLKMFSKKPIIDDLERLSGKDINKSMQGLLGNYLLRQITPDNFNIDLFSKAMKLKLKNDMEIGLSQKGKDSFFNLGWRF